MNDLYTVDYTRLLPPSLKSDPKILALANVIAEQMQTTARETEKNIIFARIDLLDEKTLDILAYDLHVDWYDYTYPVEVKRATIKDSVKVHRRLGTKFAVETALGNVFPGARVEEWFEYNGEPFMFRVVISMDTAGVTADKQAAVLDRIRFYKNLRSHLEMITYKVERETTIKVAAYHAIGSRIDVYPFFDTEHAARGKLGVGSFVQSTGRIEIMPFLDTEHTASGQMRFGSFVQSTSRIEIMPFFATEYTVQGAFRYGGYTQSTNRVEIDPMK